MRHYRPDVFTKAAKDNGWEPYHQLRPQPYHCREWRFPVFVYGEPRDAHVTERLNGYALVHHLDQFPSEYKVAVQMVQSAMDKAENEIYGTQNPPDRLPRLPALYLREYDGDETIPLKTLVNLSCYFEKRAYMEIQQAKSGPTRHREKHRVYAGGWMKAARILARISHKFILESRRHQDGPD